MWSTPSRERAQHDLIAAEGSLNALANQVDGLRASLPEWTFLSEISTKLKSDPMTTFEEWPTDEAAKEMKERILKGLADEVHGLAPGRHPDGP